MTSLGRFVRREAYIELCTRSRFGSRRTKSSPASIRGSYTHTPPTSRDRSKTTTSWPSRRSSRAAARPAAPAPTTATLARRGGALRGDRRGGGGGGGAGGDHRPAAGAAGEGRGRAAPTRGRGRGGAGAEAARARGTTDANLARRARGARAGRQEHRRERPRRPRASVWRRPRHRDLGTWTSRREIRITAPSPATCLPALSAASDAVAPRPPHTRPARCLAPG